MTPEEALKKVQAEKPKDNFMVVNIGYDNKIVVPYKDGMAIIAALVNAEELKEGYSEKTRITEFDRHSFNPKILSRAEYERIKMAMLLNVDPKDLLLTNK